MDFFSPFVFVFPFFCCISVAFLVFFFPLKGVVSNCGLVCFFSKIPSPFELICSPFLFFYLGCCLLL